MTHHSHQLSIDIQEWQKPIEKLWEIDLDEIAVEVSSLSTKQDKSTQISSYTDHTLLRSFFIIYEHSKNVFDYEHPFEFRNRIAKHIIFICTTILQNTFVSVISFALLIKGRVRMVFYNLSNPDKIKQRINKEFSRKDLTSVDFITNLTGLSKTASSFFEKFNHKAFSKELVLVKPNGTIEEVSELPSIKADFDNNNIIFKIIDINTYNLNTKLLMDNFKGGKYINIKSKNELGKNVVIEFIDNCGVEQNTDKRRWVKFASRIKSTTKTKDVCSCCFKIRTQSICCGGCNMNICENCSFCRICNSVLIGFDNIKGLEKIFKQNTIIEEQTESTGDCIGCNCNIEIGKNIGRCSQCKGVYCEDCSSLIEKYNMSCNHC